MGDYVKAEGLVHLTDPNNAEYTLCGDAFDLATDVPGYAWEAAKRGPVTCPKCATIVAACRNVRIDPALVLRARANQETSGHD